MTHSFLLRKNRCVARRCAHGEVKGARTRRVRQARVSARPFPWAPPRRWLVSSPAKRTRLGCVSTGCGSSSAGPNGPQHGSLALTIASRAACVATPRSGRSRGSSHTHSGDAVLAELTDCDSELRYAPARTHSSRRREGREPAPSGERHSADADAERLVVTRSTCRVPRHLGGTRPSATR